MSENGQSEVGSVCFDVKKKCIDMNARNGPSGVYLSAKVTNNNIVKGV